MPSVRKLPPEEVKTIQDKGKGIRKLTEEEYDSVMSDFTIGEYGEVTPEADENRLTVRNRLKAAAKRKGVGLEFARLRGAVIRFKVTDQNVQTKPKSVRPEPPVQEPVAQSQPVREPIVREPFEDETPPVVPSLNAPPKKKGGRPKKNA